MFKLYNILLSKIKTETQLRISHENKKVDKQKNLDTEALKLSILHYEIRYEALYSILYKENYLTFSPRVLRSKKKEMTDLLEMITFLTKSDFRSTKERLNTLAHKNMTKPARRH